MPLTGEYQPSTFEWARQHAERYENSGGTAGTVLRGQSVVLLTSVGAKSGKLRKTALMKVEHAGQYAVVASFRGAAKHPDWYYNLIAHPHVELQDGPAKADFLAREVVGDERAAWWALAVEASPAYAGYQKNTERQIPVLVLTPIDTCGSSVSPVS